MGRLSTSHVVLAVLGSWLAACSSATTTEVVVVVESEVAPLDSVRLRVTNEGRAVLEQTLSTRGEGSVSVPLTFGVTSRDGLDSVLRVDAYGLVGGRERVRAHGRTRFIRGQRRVLRVVFEADCVDVRCDEGFTCHDGACEDGYVDPSGLPRYDGRLPDGGLEPVSIDGIDGGRDGGRDAGSADGGTSCEADGGTVGEPPGCTLAKWPPRPLCSAGGTDGRERSIALRDPRFDQTSERWQRIGYDLDGLCTSPLDAEPRAECETPGGSPLADGIQGRDNSVGDVIAGTLVTFLPDFAIGVTDTARTGKNAPIVRITDWNGQPDDDRVQVWVAGAVDVVPSDYERPAGPFELDTMRPDPRWDGTDIAYLSTTYFAAGLEDMPFVRDDNAYVAGNLLVARFPDRAPIDVATGRGTARMLLSDVRLVGRFAADGERFEEATILGRMSQADVVALASDLGLCSGVSPVTDMYLAAFTALVGRTLDVRGVPGTGGPGLPCDAVSAAVPFEATFPVTVGGLVPTRIEPSGCR